MKRPQPISSALEHTGVCFIRALCLRTHREELDPSVCVVDDFVGVRSQRVHHRGGKHWRRCHSALEDDRAARDAGDVDCTVGISRDGKGETYFRNGQSRERWIVGKLTLLGAQALLYAVAAHAAKYITISV